MDVSLNNGFLSGLSASTVAAGSAWTTSGVAVTAAAPTEVGLGTGVFVGTSVAVGNVVGVNAMRMISGMPARTSSVVNPFIALMSEIVTP